MCFNIYLYNTIVYPACFFCDLRSTVSVNKVTPSPFYPSAPVPYLLCIEDITFSLRWYEEYLVWKKNDMGNFTAISQELTFAI